MLHRQVAALWRPSDPKAPGRQNVRNKARSLPLQSSRKSLNLSEIGASMIRKFGYPGPGHLKFYPLPANSLSKRSSTPSTHEKCVHDHIVHRNALYVSLMDGKCVEIKQPHAGVVWKLGKGVALAMVQNHSFCSKRVLF
ncbi:hypothetical protein AVEN_42859-1 [Araneus ventricosus]|uniref:Uncharacterized protein n=1 Tax=Araneus ventricosus TaxID=182803 RepID=A0A4Y2AG86_ARAVE|nr:hypothetical protein AVEN_42859-1 [Araneus ventricosus]